MIPKMKNWKKFRDWCNETKGVFEFIGLIFLILGIILTNSFKINFSGTFFQTIGLIITYRIKVPVYVTLLILVIGFIYFRRYRLKYKKNIVSTGFLVGTWRNEWETGNGKGSEICYITANGEYNVNYLHVFNVEELTIDSSTGSIRFIKATVNQTPGYRLFNELRIINNSKIEGTESIQGSDKKYGICYTKIN